MTVADTRLRDPQPPRRPEVTYQQVPLQPGTQAVLRLTWFGQGRPRTVEEFVVWEGNGGNEVLVAAYDAAVSQGLDLCIISGHPPETLGLKY